jgi:hypothetical protein
MLLSVSRAGSPLAKIRTEPAQLIAVSFLIINCEFIVFVAIPYLYNTTEIDKSPLFPISEIFQSNFYQPVEVPPLRM